MKRGVCFLTLCLTLTLNGALFARDWDIGGHVTLDKRFLTDKDDAEQFPMFHEVFVKLKATPGSDVAGLVSTKLRFYDFSIQEGLTDFQQPDKGFPYDLLLWEAYVDIPSFLFDTVDLRVGKQRIAWGTADKINPTDNLNPDDFSDFFNFGEKVPTWAVKLDWNIIEDAVALTLVWEPTARAVLLPKYIDLPFQQTSFQPPEGMQDVQIKQMYDHFDSPEYKLQNSVVAAKLWGTLLSVDWSISYTYGYLDLPVPYKVTVDSFDLSGAEVTAYTKLARAHIVGWDFAGELFTVGWRVEAALFMPDKVDLQVELPEDLQKLLQSMGKEIPKQEMLSDEPYVKVTAGIDYTFKNGIYINVQYAHGFMTEQDADSLHDYIIARIEQKFLNDSLKLSLGSIFESDGFEDIEDNYGVAVIPEVLYKPYDNIDVSLGYLWVKGEGNGLFAVVDDWDQVYLRFKLSF